VFYELDVKIAILIFDETLGGWGVGEWGNGMLGDWGVGNAVELRNISCLSLIINH